MKYFFTSTFQFLLCCRSMDIMEKIKAKASLKTAKWRDIACQQRFLVHTLVKFISLSYLICLPLFPVCSLNFLKVVNIFFKKTFFYCCGQTWFAMPLLPICLWTLLKKYNLEKKKVVQKVGISMFLQKTSNLRLINLLTFQKSLFGIHRI